MTKKKITIAGRTIGYGEPVFVIAEAGVNHNGKLATALKLVDVAARAGADAVKFQTFKAEDVVIGKKQSQLAMLRALELKDGYYSKIINRCKQRGIVFLSTPHGGFTSVDFLHKLKVPAFKFGSGDLTNLPVLKYAARFNKPMILGTGMSTIKEVKDAVQCIKKAGNNKIIVLHCTTNYPCSFDEVNLSAMQTMMKELGVLVGYSDHTLGSQVPIVAAALGACVIEKHVTLDKTMKGPDHKASLEPGELKITVHAIRQVRIVLGSPKKEATRSEVAIAKNARKSLVAVIAIKKGELLTDKNIGIKRPGGGLAPRYYFGLLGKKAKRNILADSLLTENDYE